MMQIVDIVAEHATNWVVRDLPIAALRGVARDDLAAMIAARPHVTARAIRSRTGFRRCQPPLRQAAIELSDMIGDPRPPAWELEAFIYAQIGAHIWDLAHDIEHTMVRPGGQHAGYWALEVVRKAYVLNPSATTAHVQLSYQTFFDTAVLDGLGRVELCS